MSLRDPVYRNPEGYDRIQIGRSFARRHGMLGLPDEACGEIAYMLEIGWREDSVARDIAERFPEYVRKREPEEEEALPIRRRLWEWGWIEREKRTSTDAGRS